METLVLDHSYLPIDRVRWQDAMVNWACEKVEILASYSDRIIHHGLELYMPAVVRFLKPTRKRKRVIRFSRDNIYLRDKGQCQYCAVKVPRSEFQYDHVIPRAQGGKTWWTNIVVACHGCNQKKGRRTPAEARMRLIQEPVVPKSLPERRNPKLVWSHGLPEEWKFWMPTRDQAASKLYWEQELES
jgi:5-methylcytosine-specific restriction endonuclease McrA